MLEVIGVSKKFGELIALKNVSFKVDKKECLGIIGPNGAGKTTLFNIISGFIKPDSGDVKFRGVSIIGKKPSHIAKMGLVRTFQIVRVFKNLSVKENIFVANSHSDSSLEILKDFGLWSKRDLPAKNLSQGELRKLSIAMALVTKPKVLLLDEPFSALSPKESEELISIIKELKEDGITQIVIEHKLKELFNVAERVLVLNFGEIIFEGEPKEAVRDKRVIEAYLGNGYAKN